MEGQRPLLEEAFEVPEFGPKDEEPLSEETSSLLYVGYLTDTIKIGSHEIRIRTLRIGEELQAALLAKKYRDTIEEGRALATALVAGAILSVDGEPLLGESLLYRDTSLEAKFDYILNNWYWEPVRKIWQSYNDLLQEVQNAGEELKKD